ncbi:MAG: exodeoxyribonuclease VII large subunit [Clostridia bacterium]|nr:exodeoxyribonuclease VII large subunit [Clostridia bacterium]
MDYEKQVFTVTQLNLFIKDLFAQVPLFSKIKIKGEISNFKHHSSGHLYMSLKDESGVIRAVMFRTAAMSLNFRPENGMQVIAEGRVSVYERDGQYQLYINSMSQDGKGNLYEQFEKLKAKLQAEGIFDPAAKKPIPGYPSRVGVVTAPTGAAVRDIINILSRRFSFCDICLYPALVQGSGAAESIVRGIEYFNLTKSADVLIVGRGGGSVEDLWAFNEEIVARAIFASEIPVISAVGHETDFTIADFAADLRAPTPSAAAELAVPSEEELCDKIHSAESRLKAAVKKILENRRLLLKLYADKQIMKEPTLKINEKGIYLDHLTRMFGNAIHTALNKKNQELCVAASKLDALSPLGTLKRGYAVAKTAEGEVVKSIRQIQSGDKLSIKVSDGEIKAVAE